MQMERPQNGLAEVAPVSEKSPARKERGSDGSSHASKAAERAVPQQSESLSNHAAGEGRADGCSDVVLGGSGAGHLSGRSAQGSGRRWSGRVFGRPVAWGAGRLRADYVPDGG